MLLVGTMFRLDSRIAGDILGITPEAYRQRLSRIRSKVADFLREYCGEYGNGSFGRAAVKSSFAGLILWFWMA